VKNDTPRNMEKIAKRLRGERRGKVNARGGYFGAMQLVADAETRLRAPAGGGRRTNPDWTERRLLPLTPETLKRLEDLTEKIRADRGIVIEPMQLAALILERTAEQVNAEDAEELVQRSSGGAAMRRRRRGG
jgi:hypothetical protein